MGGSESKTMWEEQFICLSNINENPKQLKHKVTHQRCEMIIVPTILQDLPKYGQRITQRLNQGRSNFLTPLVGCQRKNDKALCGYKQILELTFGQVSPTLVDFVKYRKVINQGFNQDQILYVIRNVSFALKDIQNMKEDHGRVELSTICVTSDVFLKDCFLLQEEDKLNSKKRNGKGIDGFPSPQKLKSYYDSLTSFEQMRGDLFSLGMVALQLYYTHQDLRLLYSNPDTRYRNFKMDLNTLASYIDQVREMKLKAAIEMLTSLESRKRLDIFQFLKGVTIDQSRLRILKENVFFVAANGGENGGEQFTGERSNSSLMMKKEEIKAPLMNVEPIRQTKTYEVEPQKPLNLTSFSTFNTLNTQQTFTNTMQTPIVAPQTSIISPQTPIFTSHQAPLITPQIPSITSQPSMISQPPPIMTSQTRPLINYNQNKAPQVYSSALYAPVSSTMPKEEMTFSSIYSSVMMPRDRLSDFGNTKINNNYSTPIGFQNMRSLPTVQEIMSKMENQHKTSVITLGKSNSPITSIEQTAKFMQYPKTPPLKVTETTPLKNPQKSIQFNTEKNFYPMFDNRKITAERDPFIPRSASVTATESIYHDEFKQDPFKLAENIKNSDSVKLAERMQKVQSTTTSSGDIKKGINAAISTVSAAPPVTQWPLFKEQTLSLGGPSNGVGSYRNIPSPRQNRKNMLPQSLDLKLIVPQSLDRQYSHSSLMKSNEPVYVVQQYNAGTKYEGCMVMGMRNGKGKYFYKQGSYYDGDWKDNKMHGFGTLYYPNGSTAYEGEWKEDEFDGKGIVYNDQQQKMQGSFDFTDFTQLDEEWVKYEGDLKSDEKQGFGRLMLTNGEVYEGEFFKDMVHGVGVFKSEKSEKRGIWENGKLKKLL